jgi:hypothetical protein
MVYGGTGPVSVGRKPRPAEEVANSDNHRAGFEPCRGVNVIERLPKPESLVRVSLRAIVRVGPRLKTGAGRSVNKERARRGEIFALPLFRINPDGDRSIVDKPDGHVRAEHPTLD